MPDTPQNVVPHARDFETAFQNALDVLACLRELKHRAGNTDAVGETRLLQYLAHDASVFHAGNPVNGIPEAVIRSYDQGGVQCGMAHLSAASTHGLCHALVAEIARILLRRGPATDKTTGVVTLLDTRTVPRELAEHIDDARRERREPFRQNEIDELRRYLQSVEPDKVQRELEGEYSSGVGARRNCSVPTHDTPFINPALHSLHLEASLAMSYLNKRMHLLVAMEADWRAMRKKIDGDVIRLAGCAALSGHGLAFDLAKVVSQHGMGMSGADAAKLNTPIGERIEMDAEQEERIVTRPRRWLSSAEIRSIDLADVAEIKARVEAEQSRLTKPKKAWVEIGTLAKECATGVEALVQLHKTMAKVGATVETMASNEETQARALDDSGWYTVSQAESLSGVNRGTLSRAAKKGLLASNSKEGRALRIDPQALDTYAQEIRRKSAERGIWRGDD